MRVSLRTTLAVVAVVLLVAGGCSRDDEESSGEAEAPESTVPVEVDPAKDFDLEEPVRIVALISDPSNSDEANAIPDYNDGARLAVQEINEAGGIGGRDVEFTAIDTPPVGDEVINSYNLALQENPTVLVGPVSSTATLSITDRVASEGIPLVHNSTDPNLATDAEGGNEWTFASRPPNDDAAAVAAEYLTDELGAENVGLLSVNASFGQQGVAAAEEVLGDAAGPSRSFEFNATNLTEPVQAMSDADAILDWGTPNTLAASVVTAAEQGLDIPHMGPGSIGFSSFKEGVGDPSILENVYGAVDCNPGDDERQRVQEWRDRYVSEFGYEPSYSSAELYDTVYMLRQVIESAEEASPAAIRDGFADISYDQGTCATEYRNENGFLTDETTIGRYEEGDFVTLETYGGG